MIVYKYRGGTGKDFLRDIKTIENNQFWASTLEQLNDPCEAMTDKNRINRLFKWIAEKININSKNELDFINNNTAEVLSLNGKMGIFALSKTPIDELLWAHYANSHKGFCLGFDLDILLECDGEKAIYSFPVKYKKRPPRISLRDIARNNYNSLIRKFAFYKPQRWEYEKEHRIVTSKIGLNSYYYKALKSIYFGLRISEEDKNEIMKRLSGRDINYFQIEQVKDTYHFKAVELEDKFSPETDYLKYIPVSVTRNKRIKYEIFKNKIRNTGGVGEFHVKLEEEIDEIQLLWLSRHLKKNLFPEGKALFFNFHTKDYEVMDLAWAYATFQQNEWNLEINK